MVLPQETVLGAFTGSTPEYGPVAEVAASPADASYLYATVAEVDYLTNDTVNRRQVVFRLHDPANKAQGIVFEAGRQYTFLLTLGLDGEEIVFSIPTVSGFNTDAVVDAPKVPFPCGIVLKGYISTANYNNTGLKDFCWTTTNIAESGFSYDAYTGHAVGEHGYYYAWANADAACKQLGTDWSIPEKNQWEALRIAFPSLAAGAGTTGTTPSLLSAWTDSSVLAGVIDATYGGDAWETYGFWWSNDAQEAYGVISGSNDLNGVVTLSTDLAASVRCVRTL
ncbi:hypothetical protein AGMMS49525_02170 [Bacteroidia bacterium]|nr:hypothetical protein AGMMS49525_02170 [Bacteroidia bacterium]